MPAVPGKAARIGEIRPAGHTLVHNLVDLADLPLLRLIKSMVQRLLVKLLGTDGIARVAVQKRLNHARFRVLRHEVLLMFLEITYHFRAERQLPAACPVDGHCLRPHLLQVGSGCGFILQNVNLCLFRADLHGQETPVAGAVEGQEVHCV